MKAQVFISVGKRRINAGIVEVSGLRKLANEIVSFSRVAVKTVKPKKAKAI